MKKVKSSNINLWVSAIDLQFNDELLKLLDRVKVLEKQMNWLSSETAVPFIQNVAAQVLLFIIDQRDVIPSAPAYFDDLKNKFPVAYNKLQAIDEGGEIPVSLAYLIKIGDAVIKRQNMTIHPTDEAELCNYVAEARRAFTIFPELINSCNEEFNIINNYHHLKQAFPKETLG